MPNPKERVKRSDHKQDLNALDDREAYDMEMNDAVGDQFGVYLNEYALAKKASFIPSELANTESVLTQDRRVELSNMFEDDPHRHQQEPIRQTIKKQNTILESFYTEGMDFYDLDEEAKAKDRLYG